MLILFETGVSWPVSDMLLSLFSTGHQIVADGGAGVGKTMIARMSLAIPCLFVLLLSLCYSLLQLYMG